MIRQGGTIQGYGRNSLINNDEFPLLDFKELSLCLQECDFVANEELVSRPTSSYVRTLFEQILDTFMGLSNEYCVSTSRDLLKRHGAAASLSAGDMDDSQDEPENYDTTDSVNVLVLFRAANVMLQNCGIHDFTLMDLMRPEAGRIRRILSGVINFARFREEYLRECEPLARVSEENVQEVRNIEEQNIELAKRIETLKERLREEDEANGGDGSHKKSSLIQLNHYNSKLEQELKKLQRSQELLKQEHTAYKESKTRLFEKLEDNHYLIGESTKELEKLKTYSTADLGLINRVVEDLKQNLQASEDSLRTHEAALRNKAKTLDSIQIVEDELRNLMKIAQEITNDLKRLETARDNLAKQSDELDNKKHTSEELVVHIQRVRRKLQKSEEKIVKLRQQANEREQNAKEKLKSLEAEYDRLSNDREAKQEKLDQTKAENHDYEVSINKLRLEFDNEFRNTEAAVAKLNGHIREYLADIERQL